MNSVELSAHLVNGHGLDPIVVTLGPMASGMTLDQIHDGDHVWAEADKTRDARYALVREHRHG